MRTAVVLPAPLGPRRPSTVPAGTSRLTPSRALTSPKYFFSPSATTAGFSAMGAFSPCFDPYPKSPAPGGSKVPAMALEIKPVRTRVGRHVFVDLPFRMFKHDPTWIPPLRISVLDRISPKYPANDHQDTALWMAYRNGKPVGRIGACVDHKFNEFQDESWAWGGFFECFDDPEAAGALFDTACRWASAKGVRECVGPASFTTNDVCGLLVDGFDHPPMVLTPQNPRYYEHLWVDAGWEPAMDLWGWQMDKEKGGLGERQQRVLERLRARADVQIRTMRMDDFDAEVDRFFKVYHSAWARNWGFAPMTEAEIKHLAKDLKRIIDPSIVLMVEKAGEPVGVSLSLPDANQAMTKVRSGRLLPLGWWHLLRGM